MALLVIVSNRLPAISAEIREMARQATIAAAGQIAEEAATSMEGQMVPPSLPGHAPAIRSGILHGSIKAVSSDSLSSLSAVAYTDVEYAQHLEYGTVHMEARPFMVPAAEHVRPSFEASIVSALKRL